MDPYREMCDEMQWLEYQEGLEQSMIEHALGVLTDEQTKQMIWMGIGYTYSRLSDTFTLQDVWAEEAYYEAAYREHLEETSKRLRRGLN